MVCNPSPTLIFTPFVKTPTPCSLTCHVGEGKRIHRYSIPNDARAIPLQVFFSQRIKPKLSFYCNGLLPTLANIDQFIRVICLKPRPPFFLHIHTEPILTMWVLELSKQSARVKLIEWGHDGTPIFGRADPNPFGNLCF